MKKYTIHVLSGTRTFEWSPVYADTLIIDNGVYIFYKDNMPVGYFPIRKTIIDEITNE
jgi:hypothetical protein